MSAALAMTANFMLGRRSGSGLLVDTLRRHDDDELLQHFVGRDSIRFFPVADPETTRRDRVDRLLDNCFEFHGESLRFPRGVNWQENPAQSPRWHAMLHGFSYATGLGMAFQESQDTAYLHAWIDLTESWMEAAPIDSGSADVTAQRVQSWIYAYYYFVINNHREPVPAGFHRRFLQALHQQVEHLVDTLNTDRTTRFHAVFLAGLVFPEFRRADTWRRLAIDCLVKRTLGDLLPDGVQCELSTDTHHQALKSYLNFRRLAAVNQIAIPAEVDERLKLALEFSAHAHKPDGRLPSLGDGDAQSSLDLLLQGYELFGKEDWLYVGTRGQHGSPPASRSVSFSHAGYHFVRSGWGEQGDYLDERYLAFDCGPIGAGDNGHLDALNIELAAYGRSLIVDPGRFGHEGQGPIDWHSRFRGTAYHNTIQVDGLDQTEHRPGRGRKAGIHALAPDHRLHRRVSRPGFEYLYGSARSHRYDADHHRHVFLLRGAYWLVIDQLQAPTTHRYDLRFHLSEAAEGRLHVVQSAHCSLVDSPGLLVAHCGEPGDEFDVEPGYVARRYREKLAAPVLRYTRHAASTWFATLLYPWQSHRPQADIRILPVRSLADTDRDALAVRINSIDDGVNRIDDCMVSSAGWDSGDWAFGSCRVRGDFLFASRDGGGRLRQVELPEAGQAFENGQPLGNAG